MVVKSSFVSFIALALGSIYANAGQYEFHPRGNPQPSGEQTFAPAPGAGNYQYSYTPSAGSSHQYSYPQGQSQWSGEQAYTPAPDAGNYPSQPPVQNPWERSDPQANSQQATMPLTYNYRGIIEAFAPEVGYVVRIIMSKKDKDENIGQRVFIHSDKIPALGYLNQGEMIELDKLSSKRFMVDNVLTHSHMNGGQGESMRYGTGSMKRLAPQP